jgi:hypothetical protein
LSTLDEVEFVSLWVGERGPVPAGVDLVKLFGADSFEAGECGAEVGGDEVQVQPVLYGLALGYLWKAIRGPEVATSAASTTALSLSAPSAVVRPSGAARNVAAALASRAS